MVPQPSHKPAAAELDEITLARAQRGDAGAQRALVLAYQRPVHALLWRLLAAAAGRRERVEDLAQETFIRVLRALPRFAANGPARLSTWILTIATRLALNELRDRGAAPEPLPEPDLLAGGSRPDREAERRAVGARVRAAIDALTPDHRAVLVLREYHELEYGEIATALEIDLNTVKSRLSRARATLREALKEMGDE